MGHSRRKSKPFPTQRGYYTDFIKRTCMTGNPTRGAEVRGGNDELMRHMNDISNFYCNPREHFFSGKGGGRGVREGGNR